MIRLLRQFLLTLRVISRKLNLAQTLTLGYAIYIGVTFILLLFPFTRQDGPVGTIDCLFTATSAVSTTGLASVNTPVAFNFWGQLIILLGIQVGGLGYMTFGSFILLASRGTLSRSRLKIGKAVFAMPESFDPIAFLKRTVIFTFAIEAIGAVFLYFLFARAGVSSPLWPAIFHSISAFCTAGFSVFPNSLEDFRGDAPINLVISLVSLAGALGFIVLTDFWLLFRRQAHSLTLTSKIILVATFGGIGFGTVALFFDPSIASLPFGERSLTASFQAMTALTTVGFNTHPIGAISTASIIIVLLLMILGASPSGTGGGLKSTTWSAAVATTLSLLRNRREVTFFRNTVPQYRIQAAFGALTLYLTFLLLGSYLLLQFDDHSFEDVTFEVASALGTVGLSRGITGELTAGGELVLIGLMFVGRVGVVAIGLATLSGKRTREDDQEEPNFEKSDLII